MRQALALGLIGLFIAACLIVAAVALGPPPTGLMAEHDKILHASAFWALMLLGAAAFPRCGAIAPVIGLLLGGVGIELAQALPIIHRDADIADVLADACGIVLGWTSVMAIYLFWRLFRSLVRPKEAICDD